MQQDALTLIIVQREIGITRGTLKKYLTYLTGFDMGKDTTSNGL